jgi:hypothetical protein
LGRLGRIPLINKSLVVPNQPLTGKKKITRERRRKTAMNFTNQQMEDQLGLAVKFMARALGFGLSLSLS